jgi:hypothetical protein
VAASEIDSATAKTAFIIEFECIEFLRNNSGFLVDMRVKW